MNGIEKTALEVLALKVDVVEAKVDIMLTKFDYLEKRDEDHEVRIRANEKWRYMLPTSLLLAIASVAFAVAR